MGNYVFLYFLIFFSFSCKTSSTASTRTPASLNNSTSNQSSAKSQTQVKTPTPSLTKDCASAEKCLGPTVIKQIQAADTTSLAKLEEQKKDELKAKAKEFTEDLTEYQQAYKACQNDGIATDAPILTDDEIAKIKALGVENLGQAMILIDGPSHSTDSSKNSSSNSNGNTWYKDQTNWGLFNMFTSITLIAATLTTSTKVDPKLISKFSNHYSDFTADPSFKNKTFKDYLVEKKVEYSDGEMKNIERAMASSERVSTGKKVAKYTSLAFGAGMFISGAVMTAVSLSLTDQGCSANTTLLNQLGRLKEDVATLKSEINMIDFEQDKNAAKL